MQRTPPKTLSISDTNLNKIEDEQLSHNMNITVRGNSKRVRLEDDIITDKFELFKTDIMEMLKNTISPLDNRLQSVERSLSDIKQQNSDIKSSNIEIEKSIDFIKNQIIDFEGKISKLEKEHSSTKVFIAELEDKMENLERLNRKTSIEIRGVPKRAKENKSDILGMIANLTKIIRLESTTTNIKDVYRLPSKNSATTSTIVVEFTNIFTKDSFLRGTRQYNNEHKNSMLNSNHLGMEGALSPIYFSDHLTSKSRRLHFLARDFAATEHYRFCWTANGRIFLRKEEGAKHVLVKNENTLMQLRDL